MSAAGTPSTDPWVIVARERARYEEQFKSLKPNNGIITGDQAKAFFLQSQLSPLLLGQIWALADTDADGKMNIDEFSIACKLINLKLRGFDVPKGLPPSLLASLKVNTPPAVPPLPSAALVNPPGRPEPPKIAPIMASQPGLVSISGVQPYYVSGGLIGPTSSSIPPNVSPISGVQTGIVPPIINNLSNGGGIAPIPTGIVPPMQSTPLVQPLIDPIGSISSSPLVAGIPLSSSTIQPVKSASPLVTGIPPVSSSIPPIIPPTAVAATMSGILPAASGIPSAAPGLVSIPSGVAPLATGVQPISNITSTLVGGVPVNTVAPLGSTGMTPITAQPVGINTARPGASNTPRSSVASLERTHSIESVSSQPEWSVPHQTKLKYTQIFNTTDRTRSGFLSGAQARNVMVQTKLPQNILAQIWALADMDVDGRLGCEEFVLAMHLCEQAALGHTPPAKLPPDLIPPSFRRTRTTSISSQGSAPLDQDPVSSLLQNSFEDKRKENFEKGQAELERRRKALSDQLRQEREERERKEREEQEKKEKARQEAERKRLEELEKQMREQQEKERLIEEEKKRQAEQRESARKEMERQRQLEWEKQRLQELQNQRQREQENVLKLKAKNQSLTIELNTLNDQVKELHQKICDTRMGVSNVKSTIDNMRSTRDSQMSEMSQLKNKLKEQNARLLQLSQDKIKLDAKSKANAQDSEHTRLAFENKEITIKNLKTKVDDMQSEIDNKLTDIENNNSQLKDLKTQLKNLINDCEQLYSVYEVKRSTVLEMKNASKGNELDAWKSTDAWGPSTNDTSSDWPVDNWTTSTDVSNLPGIVKYKALYEFVARNNDEISFQPGDIINVPKEQTGEPGWLAGEIRGHTGWFPEAYVEPLDGVGVRDNEVFTEQTVSAPFEDTEAKRLEGIAEVPEGGSDTTNSFEPVSTVESTIKQSTAIEDAEYYIANYPYQSQEPGDLTFNAGEVIAVIKKDGDWWTGKLNNLVGIFPSNYVQKVDVNTTSAAEPPVTSTTVMPVSSELSTGVSAQAVQSALADVTAQQTQVDNEISQISFNKAKEDANAQVVKTKKPEIASVIAPYQSTSPEQLSLARGQLIMIRKKTDGGWWEGELQAKGRKRQVGWFPASYVKVLNSSGKISGRSTPVSTTRMQQEVVIDKVIALYPYTASNPDELTFVKDDIISVTAREEEAWWRGELNGVSGLFPSNYVAPFTQSQTSPWSPENQKRHETINEFIQTEKTYVSDMSIVHEIFEEPLRKSKLVSSKDIDEIFINWQDIIKCNKRFLKDLIFANKMGSDMIGDIICKHLPEMKAYITFCGKQLDSAALLQRLLENSTAFRELVKKCQYNVATKGMPLSSFLLKPMQRITRYPLLINKILENTPENHPDYKNLRQALTVAERFLNTINENVRLKENQDRLNWLQLCVQNDLNLVFNCETNRLGPRQLLHYGIFNKLKNNKELLGFLFNDFFILVQASKSLGTHFSFQMNGNFVYKLYKQPILIQNLTVSRESTENVESGTDSNRVLNIMDEKVNYKIALLVSSVTECSLWMKRIESAKETCSKIYNLNFQNKRKTQLHLGPSCGRLLVLVQKGKRFISIGRAHPENIYCRVTLGNQEQETDFAKENFSNGNPVQNGIPQIPTLVWNYSMQFQLRNINQEVLNFVVFKQNQFCPDDFLGKAEIKIKNILRECQNHNGPISKKLILHQVESGEILVKLDLHLFDNY